MCQQIQKLVKIMIRVDFDAFILKRKKIFI